MWQSFVGFNDGAFKEEIVPVSVIVNGKQVVVDKDQHPRPNTTMEALSKLPALFREGGVGTVGNSTVSLVESRIIGLRLIHIENTCMIIYTDYYVGVFHRPIRK